MRNKILYYVLAFSLCLNAATAATLSILWWKKQAFAETRVFSDKSIDKFMIDDLKIENSGAFPFLKLIEDKRKDVEILRQEWERSRLRMIDLVTSPDIDMVAINEKITDLNRIHSQIRLETITTLATISSNLSPEQRKQFSDYLQARICALSASRKGILRNPLDRDQSSELRSK